MRKRELSPKEQIILALAKEHNLPIHIVEEIVMWQFDSMLEAMSIPEIKSAELTGFGRFIFSTRRAERSIVSLTKYVEEHGSPSSKAEEERTKACSFTLEALKNKTNISHEQI